jgi:hypothetical protein
MELKRFIELALIATKRVCKWLLALKDLSHVVIAGGLAGLSAASPGGRK